MEPAHPASAAHVLDHPKNQKRTLRGWAIFDWANSAYSLVITVAIFPGYFLLITSDHLRFLGMNITDSTLYAYSLSFSYLLIALFSPFLSGIADYAGRKKYFMRLFTTGGALACIGLLFFTSMGTLWIGMLCFIVATIGFAGGIVFYNAFLPEIATEDRFDAVSALGFSYGFLGSVILLLLNLIVIQNFAWFGFASATKAIPVAFAMVGLWWFGFAQIPFKRLPEDSRHPYSKHLWRRGYEELTKTMAAARTQPNLLIFLVTFFCFNAGTQAVLLLASIFADKELHFSTSGLIVLILILQLVGIVGAYFFAWLSKKKGNIFALTVALCIWTVICSAGFFVKTGLDFYLLAMGVGLAMGGTQSLSRSTYAKILPENTPDTTSYFSFYDVLDKVSTVMGTFVFGFIEQITHGMRNSVLSLAAFFIIGLILLNKVKVVQR